MSTARSTTLNVTLCNTRAPPNGASTTAGRTAPTTSRRKSKLGSRKTNHTASTAVPMNQKNTLAAYGGVGLRR